MTCPFGVSLPSRAYRSIFPRWFTLVAQSMTNGKASSVGIPKHRGLVPIMPSTPKVGAMEGRALVVEKPTQPASVAMVA